MAETTKIEWANATWNPWMGCKKVSAGCAKCYMFRDMKRYGKDPTTVTRAAPGTFNAPLIWARRGKVKPGSRIFTCSWSDWFIEQADAWRDEAWYIVKSTPFTYLILTKRPERIADHLPADWGRGYPNVWLGVSAENQDMADERIPQLLKIPARVRFVSAEPLLGPIDFIEILDSGDSLNALIGETCSKESGCLVVDDGPILDWIITGGESDPKSPRPCDLDWVRGIRDQCIASGTAFFHKQLGGKEKIDGAWGGKVLDGKTWHQFPNLAD